MIVDPNYAAPLRWDAVDPAEFDALLLPGGHRARGMRDYLESDILQTPCRWLLRERKTRGGDLPWRVAGRAQHFAGHGPFGALRISKPRR